MRTPDYQVFIDYSQRIETVTHIGLDESGNLQQIDTNLSEHTIVGDRHKYHLREYTGVRDMNGVKIYEGDITLNDIAGEFIGQIIFVDGRFTIQDSENKKALWILSDKTRVIGNIYENPELLTA